MKAEQLHMNDIDDNGLPNLVTEREAAGYLNRSLDTVRRLRRDRVLPQVGVYASPSGHIVPLLSGNDVMEYAKTQTRCLAA